MKLQKIALELAAINFNRDPLNLNQLMEQYPIADIAQVFAEQLANQTLSEEDVFELVQLMPIARQAALLGYFSEPIREKVVERMPLEALAKVLQVMPMMKGLTYMLTWMRRANRRYLLYWINKSVKMYSSSQPTLKARSALS